MKKAIWFLGGLIIVMVVSGYIYRDLLALMMFRVYVKPTESFAESVPPSAPDYFNLEYWAALPDREDGADFTPAGVNDGQSSADVDVFFVHPTTYLNSAGWNAPMGDKPSGNWVDDAVMPGQASVFNGAARVFAPRYRQAQIYAFFALEEGGYDALELAYSDIAAAFDHYMAEYNEGRPFIVAGHSQGALLTRWLLERKISGTQLRDRMIAAYPVGYLMSEVELADSIPDIPVCESALQAGCLVSWNTIGDGYRALVPTRGMVCVNPLTWTNDGQQGTFEDNDGALSRKSEALIKEVADARCDNGMLYVSEIRTDVYEYLPNMGRGNHHLLDYSLFWSNIRENVIGRVAAFNAAGGASG
jgi:hypothetical protein